MGDFSAFVGGVSGVFKGLKASHDKGIHNVKNLQKLKEITQRNEVTILNWADKLENEILIGYSNQLVKIFDLTSNTFTFNEPRIVGEGPIRGIFRLNSTLVTGVESGVVKVWGDRATLVETGGPISRMRHSPNEENIIGTGGKENDLKLWDIETGKNTFTAKNVRHDWLELRVPVWVMDLAFMPDSKQVAVATRYGHVRLYDPSTPTRRPVCQVEEKDVSFTCVAPTPRSSHVVVGCAAGNMYLVDLRGKGLLLNKFRGFMGGVRAVACPTAEPYVLSVSLDRHLRVHHLDTKKLLFKEYMQSRLSALLIKTSFTMEDIKEEAPEIKEEDEEVTVADEEYEQMFNEMEIITDKQLPHRKEIKSDKSEVTKAKDVIEETSVVEHTVENKTVRKSNRISDRENSQEQENITSKRSKTRAKDVIEETSLVEHTVENKIVRKSNRISDRENSQEQENITSKRSKTRVIRAKDVIEETHVIEEAIEDEIVRKLNTFHNRENDPEQENVTGKRSKTKGKSKPKRLKQAEDVIVLD